MDKFGPTKGHRRLKILGNADIEYIVFSMRIKTLKYFSKLKILKIYFANKKIGYCITNVTKLKNRFNFV